jgi:hypothetical protein
VTPVERFDGETFDPVRDAARLTAQLDAVRELMKDGQWRTLQQIAAAVGAPEASVSARLRDLRKERFGAWTVERQHVGGGLFHYKVSQ